MELRQVLDAAHLVVAVGLVPLIIACIAVAIVTGDRKGWWFALFGGAFAVANAAYLF